MHLHVPYNYTVFSDWRFKRKHTVFTVRYGLNIYI